MENSVSRLLRCVQVTESKSCKVFHNKNTTEIRPHSLEFSIHVVPPGGVKMPPLCSSVAPTWVLPVRLLMIGRCDVEDRRRGNVSPYTAMIPNNKAVQELRCAGYHCLVLWWLNSYCEFEVSVFAPCLILQFSGTIRDINKVWLLFKRKKIPLSLQRGILFGRVFS